MKFDPKIDLYLEAATGASETPSHRGKSRFPLAGVSLGAQYRPPLGQSLQCWRPNPGFDIVKQANLHYQPKYSTCRSSSAGCPPEPRLAPACRPEDSVPYISGKALISAWFEVLEPLRIFLTDLLGCHLLPQTDPPCTTCLAWGSFCSQTAASLHRNSFIDIKRIPERKRIVRLIY